MYHTGYVEIPNAKEPPQSRFKLISPHALLSIFVCQMVFLVFAIWQLESSIDTLNDKLSHINITVTAHTEVLKDNGRLIDIPMEK